VNPRGVLVTGGTGFIGGHVVRALRSRGVKVWVWSRNAARARRRLPGVNTVGALDEIPAAEPIDAIVNLAGAPAIGPPWTKSRRRVLVDSRVKTTEVVIAWCASRAERPQVLVSASAIGYYGGSTGPGSDEWLDESAPPGTMFQSQLCVAREAATRPASALGIRVVNLRIGLVLGSGGGILAQLALAARFGAAAVIGDGRQWMSWIHVEDLLAIIDRALVDATMRDEWNAVAPSPVRQREFQRALTRVLGRPLLLRIPAALLRIMLGEMAELLVQGQRVAPRRLLDAAFEFRHPELEGALRDLLRRGRS
jgi:uncharacterized protein (TIGR01777 family)